MISRTPNFFFFQVSLPVVQHREREMLKKRKRRKDSIRRVTEQKSKRVGVADQPSIRTKRSRSRSSHTANFVSDFGFDGDRFNCLKLTRFNYLPCALNLSRRFIPPLLLTFFSLLPLLLLLYMYTNTRGLQESTIVQRKTRIK